MSRESVAELLGRESGLTVCREREVRQLGERVWKVRIVEVFWAERGCEERKDVRARAVVGMARVVRRSKRGAIFGVNA